MSDTTTAADLSGRHVSLSLAQAGLARFDAMAGGGDQDDPLSRREQQVLSLVSRGFTNKEAAQSLGVAPETIKSHIKHIFRKLAVERRAHAVSRGCVLGLINILGD